MEQLLNHPWLELVAGNPPYLWGAAAAGLFVLLSMVALGRLAAQYRAFRRYPALPAQLRKRDGYLRIRSAEAAQRRGEHERAGDLFAGLELHEAARRNYHLAKAARKLAQSYLASGNRLEAAGWFERSGDPARAQQLYLDSGQVASAARSARAAGDPEAAAALYMQAGELATAAQLYREIDDIPAAFACLEKNGEPLAAARLGAERVARFMQSMRSGRASAAETRVMEQLADRSAAILAAEADPEVRNQALQLYLFARNYSGAGELFRLSGRLEKAVDHFLRAGDKRRAADALDEAGKPVESAILKGEDFQARGLLREAAAQFEMAQDWARAAVLLVELGEPLKAALHYRQLGQIERAGELFEQDGRFDEAAACYRESAAHDRALACYERLADWGSYTELLETLDRNYEAGLNYLQRGLTDKAIKAFQRVDEADARHADACLKLADLFSEKEMHGLAKEKYLTLIGQERIQRRTVELFYKLARAYEGNDELSAALQTYEKILGLDFHYQDVNQRIADTKSRIALRTPMQHMGTNPASTPAYPVDPLAATVMPSSRPRRYEVLEELGRGGMGVVYRARDTVLDRMVALKVLPAMFRSNDVALRNFVREAQSAAKLSHPNIVTVFDAGEEGGSPYIAMEFVDGRDLKQILSESGKFSGGPLMLVFGQMCQALAYAHENNIIHRDIKPSNVLWTRAKQVKITDFGLARAMGQGANTMTTTGGTPYYMSPEQTLGKPLDNRADLYSLGIMMFELATGELPFAAGDIGYHHVHTPPPDIRTLGAGVPEPLCAVIMQCLAKRPDERPANARLIFDALRAAATG